MTDTQVFISDGSFWHVKVGDTVIREFYGIKSHLVVIQVDERILHAALPDQHEIFWDFDRSTGFEEDPELGMGVQFGITCSRLIKE